MRLGSALQIDHVRQRRAEAHMLFVAEAVGRAPNSPWVTKVMQRLTETTAAHVAGNERCGRTPTKRRQGG